MEHIKCKFEDAWITDAILISKAEVQYDLPRIIETGYHAVLRRNSGRENTVYFGQLFQLFAESQVQFWAHIFQLSLEI